MITKSLLTIATDGTIGTMSIVACDNASQSETQGLTLECLQRVVSGRLNFLGAHAGRTSRLSEASNLVTAQ